MRLLPQRYDEARRQAGIPLPLLALGVLAVWLVPAFLAAFETLVFWRMGSRGGTAGAAWAPFAIHLPPWLAYAALIPLILHASESKLLRTRGAAVTVAGHVALALVCGAVYAVVSSLTWLRFSPRPPPVPLPQMIVSWFLSGLPLIAISYTAVVGGARALYWFMRGRDAEVRSAQLAAQLSSARLDTLRMQLQPHFLFNTLNAITVLVRGREVERAETALELLSALLRESLRQDPGQLVSLARELDFARRYLAIEEIRFPDRLSVQYDVPDALGAAAVPAMVLQPLIENAIRHGLRAHAAAGRIGISATAEGETLVLRVTDDGAGPQQRAGGTGIGLANTGERLRVLFGTRASVALTAREHGGTCAVLRMPLVFAADSTAAPGEPVGAGHGHG